MIDLLIGYIGAGIFYMSFEFAFMIWKARTIHRHRGGAIAFLVLFIPCALAWPYFAILRILHDEKDNI
jgi:Kef-type K+ transport system membrane component KefB